MMLPQLSLPDWLAEHSIPYQSFRTAPSDWLERIRLGLRQYQRGNARVSIVMPAYNEAKVLLHSLSSLANLTLPNHVATEILIINDGSQDETADLLKALKVPHINLPENVKQKGSRQIGLEEASGKYVFHTDADTIYPQAWGIDFLEALQKPDVLMVYGPHSFIPPNLGARLPYVMHEFLGRSLYKIRSKHREYINVHGFNSALKREIALEVGSYDHTPEGSEDGHMAWMLQKAGKLELVDTPDSLVWTSPRRIQTDGGLAKAFLKRVKREGSRLQEYVTGK
ncbi:MAG: glycosyltransferase family 2 protein [Bacteroidota bacterium]